MKILHLVQNYWPSVGGMQEVVRKVSEHMVLLGHDVTVATSKHKHRQTDTLNGVVIKDFDCRGNFVDGMHGLDMQKYKDFVKNNDWDLIVFFAAQQWAVDLLWNDLKNIKGAKVFVPTGFSCLYVTSWKDYFSNLLPQNLKYFDMAIVHSLTYRDAHYLCRQKFNNIVSIPNAADEKEFGEKTLGIELRRKLGIPEDWCLILSVGSHTGEKGHRELFEIAQKLREKNWALLIVGNQTLTKCGIRCAVKSRIYNTIHRQRKIIVTSLTRPETVNAFFSADFLLFPSNIECSPVVLFESMASGLPFLASDVGNAGL